jgi:hypothetical protein
MVKVVDMATLFLLNFKSNTLPLRHQNVNEMEAIARRLI